MSNKVNQIESFGVLSNQQTINLSKNELTRIHNKDSGLVNLKELFLQQNGINTIEDNSFNELKSLEMLYFGGNIYYSCI